MTDEKDKHVEESQSDSKADSEIKEGKESRTKKDDSSLTDKFRENPWIVSTLVLGVITLILLFGSFSGVTGNAVGVSDAGQVEAKVLSFINSQVDEPVEVVSTEVKNGLYEIVVSYQGQEIPVYATVDGERLVSGVTPLDDLIARTESQNTGATQTNVPQSDKPVVELFVMSICPYGTQAEKGILPVLMKLGDSIDFNLRFVSYAMHEKPEIDENTVQYCIQQEEPEKLYEYLECYLEENSPEAWASCRTQVGINEAVLSRCIAAANEEFQIEALYADKASWSGGRFPQYNVDKELNTQYGVRGSPTLVINGVVSNAGRSPASYLSAICAAFNEAPGECGVAMPADTPAPGFGWDALAASDTAAQCG